MTIGEKRSGGLAFISSIPYCNVALFLAIVMPAANIHCIVVSLYRTCYVLALELTPH